MQIEYCLQHKKNDSQFVIWKEGKTDDGYIP